MGRRTIEPARRHEQRRRSVFKSKTQSQEKSEMPGVLRNCATNNLRNRGPWAMLECGNCHYYKSNWQKVFCHEEQGINVLHGNGAIKCKPGRFRRIWQPPPFADMDMGYANGSWSFGGW